MTIHLLLNLGFFKVETILPQLYLSLFIFLFFFLLPLSPSLLRIPWLVLLRKSSVLFPTIGRVHLCDTFCLLFPNLIVLFQWFYLDVSLPLSCFLRCSSFHFYFSVRDTVILIPFNSSLLPAESHFLCLVKSFYFRSKRKKEDEDINWSQRGFIQ